MSEERIRKALDDLNSNYGDALGKMARGERMTDEQTYWYQCQERAMAPGIGDGWPKIIPAPHTHNARLKRMDGDPQKVIAQLRTELAEMTEAKEKAEAECARLRTALSEIAIAATIESVALRDIAEEALEREENEDG